MNNPVIMTTAAMITAPSIVKLLEATPVIPVPLKPLDFSQALLATTSL